MDEEKEMGNDMLKNIEKIQAFSKLMGQGEGGTVDTQDMMKAFEMANKLSSFMNMSNQNTGVGAQEEEVIDSATENIFSPSREIRVLNAAIPFLDKEYQKGIFIAVKLMEMKRASNIDYISMQSDETVNESKTDRRGALLRAIKPFLSKEEQSNIDMMSRMMKMKTMMSMINKEEL